AARSAPHGPPLGRPDGAHPNLGRALPARRTPRPGLQPRPECGSEGRPSGLPRPLPHHPALRGGEPVPGDRSARADRIRRKGSCRRALVPLRTDADHPTFSRGRRTVLRRRRCGARAPARELLHGRAGTGDTSYPATVRRPNGAGGGRPPCGIRVLRPDRGARLPVDRGGPASRERPGARRRSLRCEPRGFVVRTTLAHSARADSGRLEASRSAAKTPRERGRGGPPAGTFDRGAAAVPRVRPAAPSFRPPRSRLRAVRVPGRGRGSGPL